MSEPEKVRISELEHICALDLETSGLNEQREQVLEVAAIFGAIRNGEFVETARFHRVLPLETDIMEWHPVVLDMHTKNGLLVEAMTERNMLRKLELLKSALSNADRALAAIANPNEEKEPEKYTLFGNTVHFDLRFVRSAFPRFAENLSHRCFDISAIRLFCETLGLPYQQDPPAHRAMADIEGSLQLFKKYRAWVKDGAR